jgi:DNA repair exonuclease SbcCD ATPase subunit
LVDNLEQVESPPDSPSGDEDLPDGEGLLGQKTEELARTKARLVELEQTMASKDNEIASLKRTRGELEEKLEVLNNSLAKAVTSYKAIVIQANPEVIVELISGDTIESINESLDRAKALVNKVRQGIESEISLAKVPAGAPERTLPDLSGLSPREKIQYAIGSKK